MVHILSIQFKLSIIGSFYQMCSINPFSHIVAPNEQHFLVSKLLKNII